MSSNELLVDVLNRLLESGHEEAIKDILLQKFKEDLANTNQTYERINQPELRDVPSRKTSATSEWSTLNGFNSIRNESELANSEESTTPQKINEYASNDSQEKILKSIVTSLKELNLKIDKVNSITQTGSQSMMKNLTINKMETIEQNQLAQHSSKPKTSNRHACGIIVYAGGHDASYNPSKGVQVYDSKNGKWIKMGEMIDKRSYFTLVEADGKLYAIGGFNGQTARSSAEVFNPSTGEWTLTTPMNRITSSHGAAHLNGEIYVIGGYDGRRYTSAAQKYDTKRNMWIQLPDMTVGRSHFGCAALDGYVYVVGGCNGKALSICERYNSISNKWEEIASMNHQRSCLCVCVLGGFIYAVGGTNANCLASVERYDSNNNTWTQVADMSTSRSSHIAVIDDLMYAIGGKSGQQKLKSVEVYSHTLDKWTLVSGLNAACYGAGASWVDCSDMRNMVPRNIHLRLGANVQKEPCLVCLDVPIAVYGCNVCQYGL